MPVALKVSGGAGESRSYGKPADLLDHDEVRTVETAYPPHLHTKLVSEACAREHVVTILAQKPLAPSPAGACRDVDIAADVRRGTRVNQNMRFDEAVRVARQLPARGSSASRLASIESHAVLHWQGFLQEYRRLTIATMSIHRYESLRWLL
jgi:predicted dehydrogenase